MFVSIRRCIHRSSQLDQHMDKDNKKKNFKEHHRPLPGLTLTLEIMITLLSNCCVLKNTYFMGFFLVTRSNLASIRDALVHSQGRCLRLKSRILGNKNRY